MIVDLFSTPIYKGKVYIPESDLSDIKSCVEYKRNPSDNGFVSTDKYIFNKYGAIKNQVKAHLDDYSYSVIGIRDDVKMRLMNSWVMSHVRGDFAPNHYHTNSVISGVLYLQVPENSGDIYFVKDQDEQDILSRTINVPKVPNNYNSANQKICVSAGDLILFPSKLIHYVPASESDEMRFCIAFNVMPRDFVGDDELLNYISFK